MDGILLLAVLGFAAYKFGLFNTGTVLPAGTAPGTILQNANGTYTQAVQASNGQIVGQPISAAAVQQLGGTSLAKATTGAISAAGSIAAGIQAGTLGFAGLAAGLATAGAIGAAALAVYELCKLIFKGADPNQIPASKTEQVYECFADILNQLYDVGLISQAAAVALMQSAIQGAQQAEINSPQYASDPKPFQAGIQNAVGVITAEIALVQRTPPVPLKPLTLAAAQAVFVGSYPSPGWYASSVQLAYQLASGTVQNLIQNNTQ